jgi:hypothetical protein
MYLASILQDHGEGWCTKRARHSSRDSSRRLSGGGSVKLPGGRAPAPAPLNGFPPRQLV